MPAAGRMEPLICPGRCGGFGRHRLWRHWSAASSGSNPPAWRSAPPGTPSVIPPPGAPSLDSQPGQRWWLPGPLSWFAGQPHVRDALGRGGYGWLITAWDNPRADVDLCCGPDPRRRGWPVLVAHALLKRYGGLGRADHAVLTTAYACTIGLDLAVSLVSEPVTSGLRRLPGQSRAAR